MIDGQEFIVKLEDCGNHEFAGSSHTTYPEKKKPQGKGSLMSVIFSLWATNDIWFISLDSFSIYILPMLVVCLI